MITDEELDQEVDDFLEHFGVKGQQWGVRNAARAQNKALNKASYQKDREKAVSDIETARARIKSGAPKAERKAAKAEFKQNKAILGSREARKILNEKRMKLNEEVMVSRQAKNGKEVAGILMLMVGATVVSSMLQPKY